MNDLISRQAVLNCFHDWIDNHGHVHSADEMVEYQRIEALPSAEPERWIPCSERLPEHDYYGETFQATIQCEHVDGWDDYVSGYADWTPNEWDIQSCYVGQIKVVAWMPLPEPWKGGQDGET